MTKLLRLLAVFCLFGATAATAQQAAVQSPSARLSQAEADLRAVDRALNHRVPDDERTQLRGKAIAAQRSVEAAVSALREEAARVDARITGLGEPAEGVEEAPEVVRERSRLKAERGAVDAAIRRGGLASVEAQQLAQEIERSQAQKFGQKLSAQSPSPVGPTFWQAVLQAMPRDLRRVELFLSQTSRQATARLGDGVPWQAPVGLVAAVLLLFPVRRRAANAGQRYLITDAPGHRLRRSGYAIWLVLVGTLLPVAAALAFTHGLRWSGLLPAGWNEILNALVSATGYAAFTVATLGALMMRSQPLWRMLPISDEMVARLRPMTYALATLSFFSLTLTAFNEAVSASRAAMTAFQGLDALLHLLLLGIILVAFARLRPAPAEDGGSSGAGLGIVTLFAWIAFAVAAIAFLTGYIALAAFTGQFLGWLIVLTAACYLLMRAVDDFISTLAGRTSRFSHALTREFGIRAGTIEQAGLLLSGVARLTLLAIALGLLFTPFGAGGGLGTVFGRLGTFATGAQVGGIFISPSSIVRGLVVLVVGLALVRAFMRWLDNRYLPATDLDGSGRNSVSLVARYIGIALAVIWAAASLGIGVERIALLLSALSVGIGFGLQAITSNFVSGLILLAERPVKIGDLVRIGTDEGDVKRISVRSTEIQLADHSTLIVPNSELITKTVLNKTLASPLGRVQIQFSAPIESDADLIREILLDAFAQEPRILDEPAPACFIDSIVDGRILFNGIAQVSGPRVSYGARSAVLTMLLRRFRAEGIEIGTVPQKLELVPAEAAAVPTAG